MLLGVAFARDSLLRVVLAAVEDEDNERRTGGGGGSTCLCHLEITFDAYMTPFRNCRWIWARGETVESQFKNGSGPDIHTRWCLVMFLRPTWNLFGSRNCRHEENTVVTLLALAETKNAQF